jgi:hypothetical protein
LSDYNYLYQIDLESADLNASKQLVATYQGPDELFMPRFDFIEHGPDGRLYVFPPGYTKFISIINRPNLRGVACDFRQAAIELPNPYGNAQNFPNFRLGPLDGSACDTLGINNLPLADFRPEASDTNALAFQFWDLSAYAPTAWHWTFGDIAQGMSDERNPAYSYAAPGLYTVCLTASNAYASHTRCKQIEVKTSAVGSPVQEQWVLSPNPSSGMVMLPAAALGQWVAVHDLSGRQVFGANASERALDLSQLANGLYLLRVGTKTYKVVIQH